MAWGSNWPSHVAAGPQSQANVAPSKASSAFPEWDNKSQDEVILEWQSRQQLLTRVKENEMAFRKYVVSRAFPNPHEGTNTLELGEGYALKAGVKFSYNLASNEIVEAGLNKLAKIGNNGSFIADRLVSWTPNFLLTEYREIQKQAKDGLGEAQLMLKIISEFLTIDDAAPSLKLKEPKSK